VKIPISAIAVLSISLSASGANAQNLNAAQKTEIIQHAYPLYYSPIEHGFVSIACDVKLDWDTVPYLMLAPAKLAGIGNLQAAKLRFTMDANGKPAMTSEYTKDTSPLIKPVYDKFFDWASSVVTGFFMTWGSKAMRSPIPTGHYVTNLTLDQSGYQLTTDSGGAVIALSLSKDYVITRILTTAPGQTIDERPQYTSSPQGFLFTGVDATNKTAEGTTHVSYNVNYHPVDTIFFPDSVHLAVDNNVDMKFNLENCSAERSMVLRVSPPPHRP
jgi:hypothetical protein